MPNVVDGQTYSKEYKGDNGAGLDALCVQRSAATSGQRVVLIDDLVATGGTLVAGVDLVKGLVSGLFFCPRYRRTLILPVRFGSVRFGSVRFGSVRFGSVRFGSVWFGSVRFGPVRFGSDRFESIR